MTLKLLGGITPALGLLNKSADLLNFVEDGEVCL